MLCWRHALIKLQPQYLPGKAQILSQTASVALEMPGQYAEVFDCWQWPYGHQSYLTVMSVLYTFQALTHVSTSQGGTEGQGTSTVKEGKHNLLSALFQPLLKT